jgi:arylsulfatase A-like enzyme
MTDDQDVASVAQTPRVSALLKKAGVTFGRHTVSFSLCCPSRATYLSGRLAHNHNVQSNGPPGGGYGNLDTKHTLPVWLKRGGYVTGHIGKYPNGYDGSQHPTTLGVAPGWTEWNGAVDPTTYRYYGYVLNENGVDVPHGNAPADYQTDVLTSKAVDFVRRRAAGAKPFFLDVAYLAPHYETKPGSRPASLEPEDLEGQIGDESSLGTPPVPAPRHARMFVNAKAPRLPSYDEANVSDKPAYVRKRPLFTSDYEGRIDRWYRARLRSLQAVDEGVARIVAALDKAGVLDNTYVVFTSDNGWLQGENRLALRKVDVYEASTRIPLIVRGPGVEHGSVVKDWTSNVDVPATILDLARVKRTGATFAPDGMSLEPYLSSPGKRLGRVVFHEQTANRYPYAGVRAGRWKYVSYDSGEKQLYDLFADPYELHSLHTDPSTVAVRRDLVELLAKLRTCAGKACVVTGYPDSWRSPRG